MYTYENLLSEGKTNLLEYGKFYSRSDIKCDCEGLDIENCEYCKSEELVAKSVHNTGIEESLTGIYYEQMLALNDYIYTVESTNNPYDNTLEEMCVSFYSPLSLARKICGYANQKDYAYLIYDESQEQLLMFRRSPLGVKYYTKEDIKIFRKNKAFDAIRRGYQDISVVNEFFTNLINKVEHTGGIPVTLEPLVSNLFKGKDPLVLVIIEDPIIANRDLYANILKFLQKAV